METIAIQIIAVLLLVAIISAGYWRWVRPHHINLETQGLLLLVLLTMTGGLLGSTGWWFDNPSAFSWDLPPLASRMLAAAGWAFGAATLLALRKPTRERLTLVLLMLAVYLVPLAAAILLVHLDRFDPTAPITYAFFIIVFMMIIPTLWYLYHRPPVIAQGETDSPPHPTIRRWLTIVAVVTGLWGAALFITDQGTPLVWVWPGDLLTTRLIAAMLLTIATASLYGTRSTDTAQVTLVVIAVYGFGAVLANFWNLAAAKPLYVLAFGLMGAVSLALLVPRTRAVFAKEPHL